MRSADPRPLESPCPAPQISWVQPLVGWLGLSPPGEIRRLKIRRAGAVQKRGPGHALEARQLEPQSNCWCGRTPGTKVASLTVHVVPNELQMMRGVCILAAVAAAVTPAAAFGPTIANASAVFLVRSTPFACSVLVITSCFDVRCHNVGMP